MGRLTAARPLPRPVRDKADKTIGVIFWPYILAVAAYAALFTFWQVEPVPDRVHALAVLLFATCLFPLARWYARGAVDVPVFELIVLSYALQFSMPIYQQPNVIIIFGQPFLLSWEDVEAVLWLTQLGVLALIGSYALSRRIPFVINLPRLDLPLADPHKKRLFIVGAIVVGGGVSLLQSFGWFRGGTTGAIFWLLSRQMQVAIILLAYDAFHLEKQRSSQAALLYIALAVNFVAGLITGLLENAFIPLVLVIMVYWHTRRRVPWHWLAVGAALYLVLNPVKFAYRGATWYGATTSTLAERVELWRGLAAESASRLLDRSDSDQSEATIYASLARFDLIHKFAYVYRLTPEHIPYYRGRTYGYFVYGWVPRIIWPDKPAVNANEIIDIDYRLKNPGSSTNIGIGQLPEAYINFGVLGIVVVMALQGFIFAALDSSLNKKGSEGGRAIYLSVMVFFLNGIGTAAAVLFGALFQQIAANAVIVRLFATGWRAEVVEETDAGQ
jgi:hypothetical protein